MSNIFKTGINIPKVVKKLELKNYHSDLKGEFIMVWVNLTRAAHLEYVDIQERTTAWRIEGEKIAADLQVQVDETIAAKKSEKEIEKLSKKNGKIFDAYLKSIEPINDEMYAWYAQVWSQHKDAAHHCTTAEVRAVAEASKEDDNGNMWTFLSQRTQAMIIAHGNQHLKK